MAYGGMMGQTPLGGAPFNGLPTNDVRELTVRSGYDISAGDVVDVEGGEVFKSKEGVPSTLKQVDTDTLIIKPIILNNDKNIFYIRKYISRNNYERKIVLVDENDTIVNEINTPDKRYTEQIIKLNNNSALFGYFDENYNLYVLVVTENNNKLTLTLNTQVATDGDKSFPEVQLINLEDGRIACLYATESAYSVKILTLGESNISVGNAYPASNIREIGSTFQATKILNSDANKRIALCFQEGLYGTDGLLGQIISISENGSVTFGTKTVITTSEPLDKKSLIGDNHGNVVYSYVFQERVHLGLYSTNGLNLVKKSGTSIQNINDSAQIFGVQLGNNAYVFCGDYDKAGLYLLNTLGDTFSTEFKVDFDITQKNFYNANLTYNRYSNEVGISFTQLNDESQSYFIGGKVVKNVLSSDLDNTSKTAIALQSASSNQPISVGFGGYCECPNVIQGQMITSSGVIGYGVQDGWLDIRPEYWSRGGSNVVTGSYVGTGYENIIKVGKPVTILFLKKTTANYIQGMVTPISALAWRSTGSEQFTGQVTFTDTGVNINGGIFGEKNVTYNYIAITL